MVVRAAEQRDAAGISDTIRSALASNVDDYNAEILARVALRFDPPAVAALIGDRDVFVALSGGRIVGTASLEGAMARTVFVAPNAQGCGIGSRLMDEVERLARSRAIPSLGVPSSITAETFYLKRGYRVVRDLYDGDERTILMECAL